MYTPSKYLRITQQPNQPNPALLSCSRARRIRICRWHPTRAARTARFSRRATQAVSSASTITPCPRRICPNPCSRLCRPIPPPRITRRSPASRACHNQCFPSPRPRAPSPRPAHPTPTSGPMRSARRASPQVRLLWSYGMVRCDYNYDGSIDLIKYQVF